MHARGLRVAVLALLTVLALSAAAATLTDTSAPGDGGGAGASDGGDSLPAGGGGEVAGNRTAQPGGGALEAFRDEAHCVPGAGNPVLLGGAALVVAVGLAWIGHRYEPFLVAVVFVSVVVPGGFVLLGLITCGPAEGASVGPSSDAPNSSVGVGGAAGGAAGTPVAPVATLPSTLVVVVLAAGLLAAAAYVRAGTDEAAGADLDLGRPEAERTRDVGRAAGRAADRIESDADPGNWVYRAWVEMTAHLDVDHPETSTPGEFAEAAVDAGMDPGDVEELTDLFERVRYGDRDPNRSREERAVAALRRIESRYADGDPAGDGGGRAA